MRYFLLGCILFCIYNNAFARTDLVTVYNQALMRDPTYQQAVAQRLEDQDDEDIAKSSLLPQLSLSGAPIYTKEHFGATSITPADILSMTSYVYSLSVSQVVFDAAKFFAYTKAKRKSRAADADFNSAAEDLILRVAQAYFNVLKDKDNLEYQRLNKESLAKHLDRSKQQRKQGLAPITDVYTAESSYASAEAAYYAAETILANDMENLRAITDENYRNLASLRKDFPIVKPTPLNMESWVEKAKQQNWDIKSALLVNQEAVENIKQQNSGHFPKAFLQGNYSAGYSKTASSRVSELSASTIGPVGNGFASLSLPGGHFNDTSVSLFVSVPLFEGGKVVSQTRQAQHDYLVTQQKLVHTVRSAINNTRQSYLNIVSEIKQIEADKKSISAAMNSLKGIEIEYRSGSRTLIDVLTQQGQILQAQAQYATDRYAYINDMLALKKQIGTLSQKDLEEINYWLD